MPNKLTGGGILPSQLRTKYTALTTFVAISVVITLVLSGLALLLSRSIIDKVEQQLTWEVASEVAALLPQYPFDASRQQKILAELTAVNPDLDLYVLNSSGRILYPDPQTLSRYSVNLLPVIKALEKNVPSFPLYGDDPRSKGGKLIFSVAPLSIHADATGYLYLINRAPAITELASFSGTVKFFLTLGAGFLPIILGVFLLGHALIRGITRNFRQIVELLHNYQRGVSAKPFEWLERDELGNLGREISRVAEVLSRRTRDLEARLLVRRDLLAKLVHDLRGPITGLRTAVQTLSSNQGQSLEIRTKMASAIQRSLGAHANLLAQLVPIADLEIDSNRMSRGRVTIDNLIDEILLRESARADALGVRLSRSSTEPSAEVFVDRSMIDRVISNLVGNALRYTPSGGAITISVKTVADGVEVIVSDTGCGISAANLTSIFEPFFTSDEQSDFKGAGVGLGLSIVKRLLELHGSAISVLSSEGAGTSFRFVLPTSETAISSAPLFERTGIRDEKIRVHKDSCELTTAEQSTLGICHFALVPLLLSSIQQTADGLRWLPAMLPIFALWLLVTFALVGKCVTLLHAMPKALRSAIVYGAAGAGWAFAMVYLLPEVSSVPVFLWFFTLGLAVGLLGRGRASRLQKVLTILPIVLATAVWMFAVKRNELSLTALVTGIVSGATVFASFRTVGSRGILRRVVAVYVVTIILMTGAQTFHLYRIWREMNIEPNLQRRSQISNAISSSISFGMACENEKQSANKNCDCVNCILARLESFNPRLETYVFGEGGTLHFSGAEPTYELIGAMVASQALEAVRGNSFPVHLPRMSSLTIDRRESPAVAVQQFFGSEQLALLIVFESKFLDLLLRKSSQDHILVFILASIGLGMSGVVIIFRAIAPNLRGTVETLQSIVRAMEAGGDLSIAAKSKTAENFSVVIAMLSLARTLDEITETLATEDKKTRTIVLASVDEIQFHLGLLQEITQARFSGDAGTIADESSSSLSRLDCLVRSEERVVGAVFALACIEVQRPSLQLISMDLNSIVAEAVLDTLGPGMLFQITPRSRIKEGTYVHSDPKLITHILCVLLHGMMRMGEFGDEIYINAHDEGESVKIALNFRAESFPAKMFEEPMQAGDMLPCGQTAGRVDSSEPLGLAVAEAMLAHLNLDLTRTYADGILTSFSFALPHHL